MHEGELSMRNGNLRRRNTSFAAALVLTAVSSMFILGEDGLMWVMWRDAPLIAAPLAIAAAFFFVRWWRTPRS